MTIHTKLHRFLETLKYGENTRTRGAVAKFRASPLFVFDDAIVSLLVRSDSSTKSIKTLAEFGMVHLPYPEMVVQFQGQSDASPFTWFTWLTEQDGRFVGVVGFYNSKYEISQLGNGVSVSVTPTAFSIDVKEIHDQADTLNDETYGRAGAIAVRLAVLMTHIGGLDREIVEAPERLNKQRAEKKRERIASYSYVHVARVLDRDGKSHDYNQTGRKMPIHMRSGHARGQWYGKDRTEYKTVWIPPVLVNYKDEDQTKPIITKKVVA